MVDRILCLANSYKHDYRCMAGISAVTGNWVRLSLQAHGRGHSVGGYRNEDGPRCRDRRQPLDCQQHGTETERRSRTAGERGSRQ